MRVSRDSGYYTSLKIRDKVAEEGEDAYFDNLGKGYPFDVQLTDKRIDSSKTYDQPVTVRYNFAFPTGGDDLLYFTPM